MKQIVRERAVKARKGRELINFICGKLKKRSEKFANITEKLRRFWKSCGKAPKVVGKLRKMREGCGKVVEKLRRFRKSYGKVAKVVETSRKSCEDCGKVAEKL